MRVNIFSILLSFLLLSFASAKEVDIFNLLLPTAYHPSLGHAKQLVSTSGGCFIWESTSSSIVSVSGHPPNQGQCYMNGLVELVGNTPYSSSIYITAKDEASTQITNIPVRIRDLKKISIFTKSKIMNLKQIQSLQIFGFDSENNTFTSLQGLRFQWTLKEFGGSITKMGIQQSSLFLPLNTRKDLESQNYQTDILVVKALKVGKVLVHVKCIESHYQNVEDQIILYIQERFDIFPSLPVYLLAGSNFQFILRNTNGSDIVLPKDHYEIEINNGFTSSKKLFLQTPSKQSQSILRVKDSRTSIPYEVSVQVFSYIPDELIINTNEQIIVGMPTSYHIDAYYRKKLLKGQMPMNVKSDFRILQSENKIEALKKKQGKIQVIFNDLRAEKRVTAVLPLEVVLPKKQILLPVDESFNLRVIGGSGYYIFEIKNSAIAMVSFSGEILTKKVGETQILVTDQRNKQNRIQVTLRVQSIADIESLENQKQANVNQQTNFFIKAKNIRGQYYTSCNDLKLQLPSNSDLSANYNVLASSSQSIEQLTALDSLLISQALENSATIPQGKVEFTKKFKRYVEQGDISKQELKKYIDELQMYGICSQVQLTGLKSYDDKIAFTTEEGARTNIPFRVYEPITNSIHNQQSTKQILLTPLSSFQWSTNGGSYEWPNSETKVFINDIQMTENNKYPFISCSNKQSSTKYKIEYRNVQTKSLLRPVRQRQQILVRCEYPTSLQAYQNGHIIKNKIYISPNQVIEGKIRAKNRKNQYFYNDTLPVWELQDKLGFVRGEKNNFIYKNNNQEFKDNILTISSKDIQRGSQYVRYPEISKNYEIITVPPLNFVNPQKTITIPQVRSSKYVLKLKENMNRDIDVSCTDKSVISCNYKESTGEIQVRTESPGTSKVIIVDKTILDSPPITVDVQVLDPDRIVISTKKPQNMVGDTFPVHVQIFSRGKPITHYDSSQIIIEGISRLREVERHGKLDIDYKGEQKGPQTLTATLKNNRMLRSNALQIEIYPPFSLNQDFQMIKNEDIHTLKTNINLLVNCKNYINIIGGPPLLTSKILSSYMQRSEVKKLDERTYEILGLREGESELVIQVYNRQDKMVQIICKLIVKPIQKFKIYGNTNVIKGSQFRLSSFFISNGDKTKSQCDFTYNWKSTKPNIVNIMSDNSLIGVNVSAEEVGKSIINLEVVSSRGKVVGTAEEYVNVNNRYDIDLPSVISKNPYTTSQILIPPKSGIQFQEGTIIEKKSPCDEQGNFLTVDNNRNQLISSYSTGSTFVSLKRRGQIPVHTAVIVTPIASLFIENQDGTIKISKGQSRMLKFYVLDEKGRLFFNNLINVEYDVSLSNPEKAQAKVSLDRESIQITGKNNGKVFLTIAVRGQQTASDIVPVYIQTYIEPSGLVFVHVGDQIKFTANAEGRWESSDPSILNIDSVNGWGQAKNQGKVTIKNGLLSTSVTVFRISELQKVLETSSQTQYVYQPIYPKALQKYEGTYLNKRTHWQCELVGHLQSYFEISTRRSGDKILCELTSKGIDVVRQIPSEVEVRVKGINRNVNFEINQQFTETLRNVFIILGSHFRNISRETYHKIEVQTTEKLEISQAGGFDSWIISDQFYGNKQIIEVEMGTKNKRSWKLYIYNPRSGQTEVVEFQTDMEYASNKVESKVQVQQSQEQSGGWGFNWTDVLVVVMGINFLVILVMQCGKNQGNGVMVY